MKLEASIYFGFLYWSSLKSVVQDRGNRVSVLHKHPCCWIQADTQTGIFIPDGYVGMQNAHYSFTLSDECRSKSGVGIMDDGHINEINRLILQSPSVHADQKFYLVGESHKHSGSSCEMAHLYTQHHIKAVSNSQHHTHANCAAPCHHCHSPRRRKPTDDAVVVCAGRADGQVRHQHLVVHRPTESREWGEG